jgi:NAD(P)-dependent dehydrogenase (short-subunit alcohol dehydrogenase family)
MNVEGRVAIVTGAGKGIGRATAKALAGRGAKVLAVSRTKSDLESLAGETNLKYLVESVATIEGCSRVLSETHSELGAVDILINNAGIDVPREPIWSHDLKAWHDVFAVNIHGPFTLTKLAAADMIAQEWGRIVMVSSTAGQVQGIEPGGSAYAASKHALLGLMRVVALDVAPYNVTCNAVLPGWVRTPMSEDDARRDALAQGTSVEAVWSQYTALYRAGRTVTPEEVASVIAFLASEESSGVSGEGVVVALEGRG